MFFFKCFFVEYYRLIVFFQILMYDIVHPFFGLSLGSINTRTPRPPSDSPKAGRGVRFCDMKGRWRSKCVGFLKVGGETRK